MLRTSEVNPGNSCAHLDVTSIQLDSPYKQIYAKQLELQTRLGKIPYEFATLNERVKDVIYWGHCVNDEFIELIDWLPAVSQNSLKEARMEFIDMLHFGFNIAVSLSMTPEDIEQGLKNLTWYKQNVSEGIDIFDLLKTELTMRKRFNELVALMPWKTWKTYDKVPPIDQHKPRLEHGFFNYMKVLLSIAGVLGMDIQMVTDMYFAKNKENHRRQDNGY